MVAKAYDIADLVVETRNRLTRQRLRTAKDRVRLHEDIRLAHQCGVGVARLAKISGYTPSRIYQILKEG